MEVESGFKDPEKVSLSPQNRDVPSIEVTNTKITKTFF